MPRRAFMPALLMQRFVLLNLFFYPAEYLQYRNSPESRPFKKASVFRKLPVLFQEVCADSVAASA